MTPTNQNKTETAELVVAEPSRPQQSIISISTGASIEEVVHRRQLISELMKRVLVEGEHYGSIPGTGSEKKVLLKAGAEKIGTMFNLAAKIAKEEVIDLGEGHREYRLTIALTHYPTGMAVGEGVGSCSTKETKYRYRNVADFEVVDQRIPADYKEKKDEYRRKGFGAKKVDGIWAWVKYGDDHKSENPDIADTWNTVYKMAEKRAKVNAVLSATGASDFFTQDLEENPAAAGRAQQSEGPTHVKVPEEKPVAAKPAPKKASSEVNAPPLITIWETKVVDVNEEEKNGKMVYTVLFDEEKKASTLKQELARMAWDLHQNEPLTVVKASVKPGRYPGSFELLGIQS